MKKAYVKPVIMFESFTLSTNIAGDCDSLLEDFGNDATFISFNTCGILFPGVESTEGKPVFSGSWNGCEHKVSGSGGSWGSICYDVPTSTTNLYNS